MLCCSGELTGPSWPSYFVYGFHFLLGCTNLAKEVFVNNQTWCRSSSAQQMCGQIRGFTACRYSKIPFTLIQPYCLVLHGCMVVLYHICRVSDKKGHQKIAVT